MMQSPYSPASHGMSRHQEPSCPLLLGAPQAAATPKKVQQQGRTKENLVELSEAQTTFAQWPMQLYSQY